MLCFVANAQSVTMNNYKDFIEQTFSFPTEEFSIVNNELYYYDLRLMDLVKEHGTPLKVSFLPTISQRINHIKSLFERTMARFGYQKDYTYCYCTKSSHFEFILDEILQNEVHIETSSAFDIAIVRKLAEKQKVDRSTYIIANGFKREAYIQNIASLINDGFFNCIPILDTVTEIHRYRDLITTKCKIGIRVASDEEPNFSFYTSRLGIRYNSITDFYLRELKEDEQFELKILHFFVNQGISDRPFYWNELSKFITKYCELKKICPSLTSIDIGGGFPIKTHLDFNYNYEYMVEEIITTIIRICSEHQVEVPHIFTEFGSYTVGESGFTIYSILDNKLQNDKEAWYMIDGSFITNLPDTWALNQRFILLAINNWDAPYNKVNLGGLTCDSMDYYNSDRHEADIFLPKIQQEPQYIGFFNTGAYQESIGGFGGIQHCLLPSPKHVIINQLADGTIIDKVFTEEQSEKQVLTILGY